MVETLKYLGFSVEYVELTESYKVLRNGNEIARGIFTAGAAWTRAAALAGLVDPMSSFMVFDALRAAKAKSFHIVYNFEDKKFMATIFDKNDVLHHAEHMTCAAAFTTVFEAFMKTVGENNA